VKQCSCPASLEDEHQIAWPSLPAHERPGRPSSLIPGQLTSNGSCTRSYLARPHLHAHLLHLPVRLQSCAQPPSKPSAQQPAWYTARPSMLAGLVHSSAFNACWPGTRLPPIETRQPPSPYRAISHLYTPSPCGDPRHLQSPSSPYRDPRRHQPPVAFSSRHQPPVVAIRLPYACRPPQTPGLTVQQCAVGICIPLRLLLRSSRKQFRLPANMIA
jgi:hypothetical protein